MQATLFLIRRYRVSFLLPIGSFLLAGCTGQPSAGDVEARIAGDHRNLLKVIKINLQYGKYNSPDNINYVAFTAEVQWLEDVKVFRQQALRLPPVEPLASDLVEVLRRGEGGPGPGTPMAERLPPSVYRGLLGGLGGQLQPWESLSYPAFNRGQRQQRSGRYFFIPETRGWKWMPGRQFN